MLVLDEPTNDLDVGTLRALEEAILGFAGTVLVVSHDRYFLDRVATHIVSFEGDAHVEFFNGSAGRAEMTSMHSGFLQEDGARMPTPRNSAETVPRLSVSSVDARRPNTPRTASAAAWATRSRTSSIGSWSRRSKYGENVILNLGAGRPADRPAGLLFSCSSWLAEGQGLRAGGKDVSSETELILDNCSYSYSYSTRYPFFALTPPTDT